MKKILLAFTLLFSASSLSGCQNQTFERLTYGTLYHEAAIEIDNDTTYNKKENENFLLATYGDTTCGCWVYFSRVLDHIAKYDHLLTYKLSNSEIDDRLNEFGIKNSEDPAFYIIANKKIIKRTFYVDNSDMFADENRLLSYIKENIELPYMYFINEEQIQSEVVDKGGIIYYTRLSCPDCSYCTPNVLMPYLAHRDLNSKIYVYDLNPLRKGDPETYQSFKDDHYLSNKYNQELGYDTGYVPTFQYYKDKELYDMAVYFNDKVTDRVITKSYYDENRVNHLHYLDKLTKKVLTGTKLSDDEVNSEGGWKNRTIQNTYYEPFLKGFLDCYFN